VPYIVTSLSFNCFASSIDWRLDVRCTRFGTYRRSPSGSVTGKYPSSSAIIAMGGAASADGGVKDPVTAMPTP